MENKYPLKDCFCSSVKSIIGERIARLIVDLEAHERFWCYLAFCECLRVLRRSFKRKGVAVFV